MHDNYIRTLYAHMAQQRKTTVKAKKIKIHQ